MIDTVMAGADIIEKFEPYYKILKRKMLERVNVQFKEHHAGEPPIIEGDYLCVFYLVSDGNGNPGLTLDSSGSGEIMVIEEDDVVDPAVVRHTLETSVTGEDLKIEVKEVSIEKKKETKRSNKKA